MMNTPDVKIMLDAFDGAVEVSGSFDKSLQRQTKLINAALDVWRQRRDSSTSVIWFQLFLMMVRSRPITNSWRFILSLKHV